MAEGQIKRLAGRRRLIDILTTRLVGLGGAAVIGAIALIFFYLIWVVAPIFAGAHVEQQGQISLPADVVLLDTDENSEIGVAIAYDGSVRFLSLPDGHVMGTASTGTTSIVTAQRVYPTNNLYAVLDENGDLRFVEAAFPVTFDDDARRVVPAVLAPFDDREDPVALGHPRSFDVFRANFSVSIATVEDDTLALLNFNDAEEGYPLEFPQRAELRLTQAYQRVVFGPRGQWLYLLGSDGSVSLIERVGTELKEIYAGRLVPEGARLTALEPLLGRHSLMVADDRGQLTQWFLVRGEFGYQLEAARSFRLDQPVVRIIPEQRRKGLLAVDQANVLHVLYTTSERTLAEAQLPATPVHLALSPRANLLLSGDAQGTVTLFDIDNPHPEISWSTLWSRVWYEGYPEPVYSWQSSAADNDFEAKFSLTPLLFGTLKAAFYAMVLAIPIAILGAVYTAYFMAPAMRRWVKPGIEIMAALPTVILGFMAGLWLAPLIEENLAAVLATILILPFGIFAFAWLWHILPERLTQSMGGWYGAISVPLLLVIGYLAFHLGPSAELVLFDGDLKTWLRETWGLAYDQRNALVVGIAMGLAVIPTIFAIAEDAIYGVPQHLINGSLALGATPWQTLARVVILTASPGIFSAVMIGLGRAVGETMIVLMATGNTAVMDWNIFQGMRTFAANIAVELPESEVNSSHYRILFLTALVLFLITFAFNTAAELVRQRLRTRYGSL